MNELVQVEFGKIFLKSFRREVEQMRDEALTEGAKILRREEESSIRQRWYRTGATLASLDERLVDEGDRKTYQLFPATFYSPFGEWGTGRRGAATGETAPRGWRYGDKPGMEARRYSRIAVGVARPQVEDAFRLKVRELAASLTK